MTQIILTLDKIIMVDLVVITMGTTVTTMVVISMVITAIITITITFKNTSDQHRIKCH